ncbi:multidrug effflux MFS transporter [Peribacillus muralis]|uniref:multidrug effflux MFS transporter n=1 Tax=Peribacillus muralis TaxID=264697 RepID=UPI001F4EC310|nr:multidrug effflux MFS transporter [Peribacillus muralis]MCK1992800.1 multidrug effflux MFS transporter [Peribacillus muralis]MCK2013355.1 multidrug effflux MFS transporter [Peribacillus muralis]
MKETILSGNEMTKSKRRLLALMLGCFAAIGPLSLDMYLPGLPTLAEDLKSSTSLAQLSLTACLLGLALGQIYLGPLSDAKGRRVPLILSLSVYGLSSLLCAFAPTIELLLLLRFIQGIAGAGGIVISRAIVRDLFSGTDLTKFFSMLMLVNGAAPILAPVFGGQLLQFTSWRGVFIVITILGGLMVTAAFFGIKETLPPNLRSAGGVNDTIRTFGKLVGDRVFMGYAFSQGFISAAMFAYISGSPFVLQNIYGVSPQTFSLIFAMNGVGIIITSQVAGKLAGRVKEEKLLQIGLSLALFGGVFLITSVFFEFGLAGIVLALFVSVSSVGIVGTTSFSLAMQNQKKTAGSASALIGLLPFILGSLMAPLVGLGSGDSPLPMGIVMVSCHIIAMLAYFMLARRGLSQGA